MLTRIFSTYTLSIMLILAVLAGCGTETGTDAIVEVTDFDSCVEAGNAVKETDPMQCTHEGRTYVQETDEPEGKDEQPQMAENKTGSDENETAEEPQEDPRYRAEIMAINHVQQMPEYVNYDGRNIMANNLQVMRCPGCYDVEIGFERHSPVGGGMSRATMHVTIEDWQVVDVTSRFEEPDLMTDAECEAMGGRIVNAIGDIDCLSTEVDVGELDGHLSRYICCVKRSLLEDEG